MADQLLATGNRLTQLGQDLATYLAPFGAPVYADESYAAGTVPFVLLRAYLTPDRPALDGAWRHAELLLIAESLHQTPAQARALSDAVRTWALTQLTTPGLIDVDIHDQATDTDPGGIPQVREAWLLRLQRV